METVISGGDSMSIDLTTKERMLLEEQKKQEDICIKKYTSFAENAKDPELKNMFKKHASEEQQHVDTLNTILQGQEPDMNQGTQNQASQEQTPQEQAPQNNMPEQTGFNDAMKNEGDYVLCSDLLATERYVSGTYDTVVFESSNTVVRQAMQHIQQDEQRHGEELLNYMNAHGMNPSA